MSNIKLLLLLSIAPIYSNFFITRSVRNDPCKGYGAYSYGGPSRVKRWGEPSYYKIGKFCSIADNITFYLGGNHRTDWITTYPFMSFPDKFPEARNITGHPATKGPIIIGNDVWIGSGVTIMSGVTIGDGAVIGANSTVARNIPPYAIAAGNPARVIRLRFTPEQIARLLIIRWWDWPIDRIRKNAHRLCSTNIKAFLDQYSS